MRLEYIEPFVVSTMRVMGSVMAAPVTRGEVLLAEDGPAWDDLIITVPLAGDSEGKVELCMNRATAASLVARLTGIPEAALTPYGLDSLSELANMIAGNAVSALNEEGFDFILAPPRAAPEAGGDIGTGLEAVRIPLATILGDVTVRVTLKTC
jgi:chemotaxis protein CheX